ncbi:MAG: thioesterase [Bacteroidetes bacterium]|nr:thioesterase [Bacteroidota bacterium]
MYTHDHKIRVRYADTDQMGYVYYGNYAHYYEEARSEAIRALGMPYKEMELGGIMLPITRMNIKYIGPAFYDELITVRTILTEMPGRFIQFKYEIYNESAKLINEGETQLIFLDANTRKMLHAPAFLTDRLKPYFAQADI